MVSLPAQSSFDEVISTLSPLMSGERKATNVSQLQHRLNILISWFEEASSVSANLNEATILEIGCGQGDMTIPLAQFARKVLAVDPAPLDYGSPLTLGQAQDVISESPHVGRRIQWVQRDPIEYLQDTPDMTLDFVVLAHSLWYFASEQYFADLLREVKSLARKRGGEKPVKVLIAEWGMKASHPAAESHILAAKAQATSPNTDGNVRTVILPERIKEMASEAGWKMEKEAWIQIPDIEDGKWEVDLTRMMADEEQIKRGPEFLEMERVVGQLGHGVIKSMDVWTGVLSLVGPLQ